MASDGLETDIPITVRDLTQKSVKRLTVWLPCNTWISSAKKQTPICPDGSEDSLHVPLDAWESDSANDLGDGSRITARDTVPFCLWVAAAHLDNYQEAHWTAICVHGDIDTNCAIIGGIVALANGEDANPATWRRERERLPDTSG